MLRLSTAAPGVPPWAPVDARLRARAAAGARGPGAARACRAAYGRTVPVAEGRSRTRESATLLFYSIPSRPSDQDPGATSTWVRGGSALPAMLARPAAVYAAIDARRARAPHIVSCAGANGDGRTRPLTFSDYPLPSTDARASKFFMLSARVAAHRAAARLLLLRVTSPSRGPRSMWEVHLAPRAAVAIAGPPGLRLPRAQSR